LEELWAFNEEILARSIYRSKIPIVSAVGHETDFTISDFVADLRSPTPSAAAEMTIPDKNSLINNLSLLRSKITRAFKRSFELNGEKFSSISRNLRYQRPENKINQYYQYIDEFSARLSSRIKHRIELYGERIKKDCQRLDSLNPWAIIERGYSICRKIPGREIIKRLNQINVGTKIEVIISDGRIFSKVEKKEVVSDWKTRKK